MKKLFFCLLAMVAGTAYAQSDKAQKLMRFSENVESFASKYPQERVYLHFDNTSYYKGEHIWYKANVVRGDNFHSTPLSRILYVELVSLSASRWRHRNWLSRTDRPTVVFCSRTR